jgi:uncharacterized membrane protein YciS (DUF1049 family)
MIRIIISVVLLVLLAVLVSMNLGFTTSINLFGAHFEKISVVTVAAMSFALGILYSLIIYAGRYLHLRAKHGLAARDKGITERERRLAGREAAADRAPEPESGKP